MFPNTHIFLSNHNSFYTPIDAIIRLVVTRTLHGEMSATNAKHQNQAVEEEMEAVEDMVVAVVVVTAAAAEEVLEVVVVEIVVEIAAVAEVEDLEGAADSEEGETEEVVAQ